MQCRKLLELRGDLMTSGVMRVTIFRLCALAVGAFAAMCTAAAAETLIDNLSAGKKLTVTLGAEARMSPSYEGSSKYDWMPLPLFDIREAGTAPRFHSPRDGFNITLYESGKFSAGPTGWVASSLPGCEESPCDSE